MTKREAYRTGQDEGDDASQFAEVSITDHDRIAAGCDGACSDECETCLTYVAFECESNNRQLASSPFCTGAFRCENDPDGWREEGLYEAYERGVAQAIKRNVAAYLKARLASEASL